MPHIYLSTYCLHGAHDQCRHTCKICHNPCVCSCHDGDPRFDVAAHQKAQHQRGLLVQPWENRDEP